MREPRIDPYVVGRAIQQTVQRLTAEQELRKDQTDGARVDLLRACCDQISRQAHRQELAVLVGEIVRVDELPPAHVFVLAVTSLVAARHELQHAGGEVRDLRHAELGQLAEQQLDGERSRR